MAPNRPAATIGELSISFGELNRWSNRIAHALRGAGVERGDRIAWCGGTVIGALPTFGALAKLGAVFVPMNLRLATEECARVIEHARPRWVVADRAHDEHGREAAGLADVPYLEDLADRARAAADAEPAGPPPGEEDPHVVFYTSGSTGAPRGVVLSHRANVLRTFPSTQAPAGDSTVCMFPLFHMAGWSMALGAWQARAPVHLVRRPDAESLLHAVQQHRATRLYAIPAVWARILEHALGGYDLSTLRFADTGTSATPPELIDAIRDALPHTTTRVFYGSTEAGPGTVLDHGDLRRKPGTVGLPAPGVELRLEEDGEVCLRSDFLMSGYLDDTDASAATVRDGWYHTGDLGEVDDEGYLSIVGRIREVIRTGGEAVSPAAVEAVVVEHPAVDDVAVVGVADPDWGELVCACVVPAGDPPSVNDLRSFCQGRLADFEHPRLVRVVRDLPRTAATGQVQRALLAERLAAEPRPAPAG